MATKVKGLFKGLKHMSQHIFEDGKEGDIQIGYPTDVKHVAHIGFEGQGPSAESPSWMKEFDTKGYQSGPLAVTDSKENDAEVKWVSEDSKSSRPPTSRNQSSPDNSESPKKESSRRRRSKDSGGSTRSNRQLQDSATGSESPCQSPLPDIPKKSRRRKSKENVTAGGGGGSSGGGSSTRSSRSKDGSLRSRKSQLSQPSIQAEEQEVLEAGACSPTPTI